MSANKYKDKISPKAMGNYTKGAVKDFEENIVSQTDYLEKVDRDLENTNK